MTQEEQYKIDLEKWKVDIAAWEKAEKDWTESVIKLNKNRLTKPGPAPRPPTPPVVDRSKLKDLLGSGNQPHKPISPPSSGMPRPI